MLTITAGNTRIDFDEETQLLQIHTGNTLWQMPAGGRIETEEGKAYPFPGAEEIRCETFRTGIGPGIRCVYSGTGGTDYAFETLIRMEEATGDVYFEWVPLREEGLKIRKIFWPQAMDFGRNTQTDLTLLPLRQGLLIPNTWPVTLEDLPFDGQFQTAGAYMPWFAQIRGGEEEEGTYNGRGPGYIAISVTPWDAGMKAVHDGKTPGTRVSQWLIPSLGKMRYRRILRYTFLDSCDFNDLCKVYRTYVQEQGTFRTLAEKAVRNPAIRELEKCSFVHTGIKTHVREDSDFYDPQAPDKNNHLHTFKEREDMIRRLHAVGAGKIYMHLDGWAEPGYDNNHPDYTEICREAGGVAGMKSLICALHSSGDLFGIHDQYRDYYRSAESFEERYAVTNEDGSIPQHARWAGGPQSYLCASQAPYYVRRNFMRLAAKGIRPDCAYLDVFTCNEADECYEKEHEMTRRECLDFRGRCFAWLLAQGILPSSEEASDWAVRELVFCHYAPFEFQMNRPGAPGPGIPVPLYSLVYHDCLLQPQLMDRYSEYNRDDMLYALLLGQPPYLVRDPAYENIDGAFPSDPVPLEEQVRRCRTVSDFAASALEQEMLSFDFLNPERTKIRSVFAGGRSVTVDLESGRYTIA